MEGCQNIGLTLFSARTVVRALARCTPPGLANLSHHVDAISIDVLEQPTYDCCCQSIGLTHFSRENCGQSIGLTGLLWQRASLSIQGITTYFIIKHIPKLDHIADIEIHIKKRLT
eukprot:sb/3476745/